MARAQACCPASAAAERATRPGACGRLGNRKRKGKCKCGRDRRCWIMKGKGKGECKSQ